MLGAIIGGVASVASALFGGKDEQKVTSEVDYVKMVKNAEAAGFNPLTAIRNGGSAGFTTTTSPGLSASARIGNALGVAGNFFANFDPHADRMREAQYSLAMANLENLQADTALKRKASIGGVPTWEASSRTSKGSAALAAGATVIGPQVPSVEQPTLTNPFPLGSGNDVRADRPDAEAWESRYGDIFQEIGGALNFLYDTDATMKKREREAGNPSTRTWRHLRDTFGGELVLPPLSAPRGGIYAQ